MSEQERTSAWQVVRLRLHARLGWGRDVPELRQWAQFYARMLQGFLFIMLCNVAVFVVIFDLLPRFGIGDERRPWSPVAMFRLLLPILVFYLLCMIAAVVVRAAHLRRADAGERRIPVTLDGFCFATVIAPPLCLFARIGMSREQAQWFCLPIMWDPAVEPGNDRFELIYNPATGYVERLRRIGAEPRELRQGAAESVGADETAESDLTDSEATPAQRRELKRDFRSAGVALGVATTRLFSVGLSLLVCGGVSFLVMIAVLLAALVFYPQVHDNHMVASISIGMTCALFGFLGIVSLLYAVLMLRERRRRRHSGESRSVIVEGEQVYWTPYSDMYSSRNESLAQVRLDDDSQLLFRIPARLKHRLWGENARVRVTYNQQSWVVLDYRAVDAAPTRTSA